jgi:hypothetical protein
MQIKQQLSTLLSKEMDRKDFLKYVAAAGVMAVGGGVVLQSIGGLNKLGAGSASNQTAANSSARGYGASAYGGVS